MNKEYYGHRLSNAQMVNQVFDILIAVGTAGSGLSALTIWESQYGRLVWAILTALSTILALTKPVIQLNKKIETFSKLFVGHSDIYTGLLILISRIKRREEITDEMANSFDAFEVRFVELSKEDDPSPRKRLLNRCELTIRERHPPENAWFPEDDNRDSLDPIV